MKILWIEDFGGGLVPSKIIIEMFSNLIPKDIFDDVEDVDIEYVLNDLPDLFEKHTLHQIFICKSFIEWDSTFTKHNGDFDLIIIDINLESYQTPDSKKPDQYRANTDFDKKAGLYIYNRLIRDGFPDDNIAFFTGEEFTLRDFQDDCESAFIDIPKNTYEKKPVGFQGLRDWIDNKQKTDYIALRRGVIEGCQYLKRQLDRIEDNELEENMLFYKTTSFHVSNNYNYFRQSLIDYLDRIENFFPLRNDKNNKHKFIMFLKELTEKWEKSLGYFHSKKEHPKTLSRLEDKFLYTCQRQMKILRNWSSHSLISNNLAEQELAYYYIVAMRSCLLFDISEIHRYERLLSSIFDPFPSEKMDDWLNSSLETNLFNSYSDLVKEIKEIDRPNHNNANYFIELCNNYGKTPTRHEGNLSQIIKKEVAKKSLMLLYQIYWHGLFPLWLNYNQSNEYPAPNFDIESISQNSFLYFLGKLIVTKSFD